MNELVFFVHIAALVGFILISLRLGKEILMTTFVTQIILGNLFVTKQICLLGLTVTCSEVYTIGAIFSLNLLQTYFGEKVSNKALKMVFLLLLFFIVMSKFHLSYIPSKHDQMHPFFAVILGYTPRVMITSFFCSLATQKLDIELFSKLAKRLPKLPFFIPFICTSLVTQFLDTILFTFIALYGVIHSMKDVIFMSYLIKMAVIFSIAPFTFLVKRLIPNEPIQI